MKKALLVTRVSGFVPQFESDDVKILQDMGYEVHYAANFDIVVYGKDNEKAKKLGLICHHIPFARKLLCKTNVSSYHMLVDLMKEEKFDLVHCHMPLTGVLARMAAKKTGIAPVLYTGHGFHFFTGAPLKNWIFYPIERRMARYTDGLVTINEEDYERALKFSVRGKVYRMHGVGMDCAKFSDKTLEIVDRDKQKKDGLLIENENQVYITENNKNTVEKKLSLITVGELASGKNHRVVLEAIAKLPNLPLTYKICGEGTCDEALRQQAKELKIEDRVEFLGYRLDVIELLHQSDVFVFPSLREGLPVAMMEAMAAGLPVIALDIRGCRELIVDQKGGRLLRSNDSDLLAKAIEEMYDKREELATLGAYNRCKVQEYSQSVVVEERRSIYNEILRKEKDAMHI